MQLSDIVEDIHQHLGALCERLYRVFNLRDIDLASCDRNDVGVKSGAIVLEKTLP